MHDGRRTCATLLVGLDVHPREVMQILRHAQIAVTMEIYAQASSRATRAALKRLGDSLTTYSHTVQVAELRLCYTVALTNPVCRPETEREASGGACATAWMSAASPS
ncbi:MAG TPA: hypothetical protein VJT72_10245 [Pseudonocardiaceae bacterium]|nr:hypothetical protein [Pseudonocardiaceae bacterium]